MASSWSAMVGAKRPGLRGLETVPVLRLSHLTAEQKIAFSLADNKIALNADWEIDQLKVLWRELVGAEINFDLEVTGFETAEIDLLVDGPTEAGTAGPKRSPSARPDGGGLKARRPLAPR